MYFRNKDINVSLDGVGVKGVNSFSFSNLYPHSKVSSLGRGIVGQNYDGINQSKGSISAAILDRDSTLYSQFINGSGIIPNGIVGSEDVSVAFQSGYINNYTMNGSVSSIPSDSISFDVFGEAKNSDLGVLSQINLGEEAIKPRSIFLSGTEKLEIEHIQSFTYSISTAWKPHYVAGSHFPVEVSQIDGYTLSLDVDLIVNQTEMQPILNDFARAGEDGIDLSIALEDCAGETLIYKVPKAYIDTEDLSADVGGSLMGKVKFITYLEDLADLAVAL
jgi:hypothetical protein